MSRPPQGRSGARPTRRVLFGLIAAGLGVVVALVLGELTLRVVWGGSTDYGFTPRFPYAADSLVGWRHQPSGEFLYRSKEFTVRFRTNAEGFRSGVPFRDGGGDSTIIAFLGDSFVQAIQVPEGETFVNRLAARCRRYGVAQVQNYGVSNIGLVHYLTLYRGAVRRHHPDIVFVCVTDQNDIRNSACKHDPDGLDPHYIHEADDRIRDVGPYTFQSEPMATPDHSGLIGFLGAHSVLYRRAMLLKARLEQSENLVRYFPYDAYVFSEPPESGFAEHWRHANWALGQLVQEIAADSSLPVIVLMPSNWTTSDPVWASLEKAYPGAGRLNRDRVRDGLAAVAAASGFPFVDLAPLLRASHRAGNRPFFRLDGHLSPEGHRVVAGALEDWLAGTLPPPRLARDRPGVE